MYITTQHTAVYTPVYHIIIYVYKIMFSPAIVVFVTVLLNGKKSFSPLYI